MRLKLNIAFETLLLTVALPTAALAYCPGPSPMGSYERQVGSNLDYLLCLHNQQVTSLNNHADMINSIADELAFVRSSQTSSTYTEPAANLLVREVVTKYAAVSEENSQLREKVVELEMRLDELERVSLHKQ